MRRKPIIVVRNPVLRDLIAKMEAEAFAKKLLAMIEGKKP